MPRLAALASIIVCLALPAGPGVANPPVRGGSSVAAMLRGLPQQGTALGRQKASVILLEFADLQCPFCAEWARTALPVLIRDYVRPGKVRIVFGGMHFIGPDSTTALRTALAAGAQHRFWNMLELLFLNQGRENTGWVTDPLLRAIGSGIPGLNANRMLRDRQSKAVDEQLAAADDLATRALVRSTPAFAVGRAGESLRIVHINALTADALRPALNAALKR